MSVSTFFPGTAALDASLRWHDECAQPYGFVIIEGTQSVKRLLLVVKLTALGRN